MRKLFIVALCFSCAVFAVQYGVPFWSFLPLFPAVIFREGRKARLLLAAAGIALGLLWCRGYSALFFAPARALDGKTVRVEATVLDWPSPTAYGIAVEVSVRNPEGFDIKALCYAGEECARLQPGDTLSGIVSSRLSDTAYGQKTQRYTADGIFLLLTAHGEIVVTPPRHMPLRFLPQMAAKTFRQCILRLYDGQEQAAAVLTALLMGDRSLLSPAYESALARTGLSHVVAVSGMHLSFLSTLFTLAFGRRRRASSLFLIIFFFFFAAMVGNSPSVLRAAIIQSILLLGPLLGREADPPTSLAASLMLLLLLNPYAAASLSLQLSFAAAAGLLLLSSPLYERFTKKLPQKGVWPRWARAVLAAVSASFGATAFTAPLVAYYFGTVSLIAPLANLLTLWAFSALFMAGFVSVLLGLAAFPAGLVLSLFTLPLLRILLALVPAFSALPFAAVTIRSSYYLLWLLFTYCVLLLYFLWRGEKRRWPLPIAMCALTFCFSVFLTGLTFQQGSLVVSVLDVGQGQSVVLHSGACTAVVDCGGSSPDRAGNIAADHLQDLGLRQLDYLVLTHCHADHANGVLQLMDRISVRTLFLPDADLDAPLCQAILAGAGKRGTEVVFVREDMSVPFGSASLALFAPLGDGGVNEEGLGLLCTAGAFDALITGDMSSVVESLLLAHTRLPDTELLVVGHHGSKYATSAALLRAATPEAAVISVGHNSYGHPTDEVLGRLADANIDIYRTDLMGTITVFAN